MNMNFKYISILLLVFVVNNIPSISYANCTYGQDQCLMGYVWREAFPGDHVCVTGEVRQQAQYDNSQANQRRDPNCSSGNCPYGLNQCLPGYVWREANQEDFVCVNGEVRSQTRVDNEAAANRRDPKCSLCPTGQEIVIPTSDSTKPEVILELRWPDGKVLSVSNDTNSNPSPDKVIVESGTKVEIMAIARDSQGIKDIQLWIGLKSCAFHDNDTATCSESLQGSPAVSNTDVGQLGTKGCTERSALTNVTVTHTLTGSKSYILTAVGKNFGGQEDRISSFKLEAIPPEKKSGFLSNRLVPNRCIDVAGAPGEHNGANLQLWDCELSENNPNGSNTDQKWLMTPEGFIKNTLSEKCIDVAGAPGKHNGANLQLWDCELSGTNPNGSSTDQKWLMTPEGFIKNTLSGKCIDVAGAPGKHNGANLQLWDCELSGANPNGSSTDQKWEWR